MSKSPIDLDLDFDFGFVTVNEEELAAREAEAEQRALASAQSIIDEQKQAAEAVIKETAATAEEYRARMHRLYKMVMPLLNNLRENPERSYIYWPERQDKIDEFQRRIEAVIRDE